MITYLLLRRRDSTYNHPLYIINMTKQEILNRGEWSENSFFIEIPFDVFKEEIEIQVTFDSGEEQFLSNSSIQAIKDFYKLDKSDYKEIQEKIWEHCLACNQTQNSKISYDDGKTWIDSSSSLEENLAYWEIKTKEDALKKSIIKNVWLANTWGSQSEDSIFKIEIDVEWDREHGISIMYKNGKLYKVE